MKQWLLLMITGLFLLVACQVNHLPEYMPLTKKVNLSTLVISRPQAHIGASGDGGQTTMGAVLDVSTALLESQQQKILDTNVSPQRVGQLIDASFANTFKALMHKEIVPFSQGPESSITIEVIRYGVSADSVMSPVIFDLVATVRVVYNPENKLLWESAVRMERRLTDFELGGAPVLAAISASINMGAFFDLKPEQIAAIFDLLASDAGQTMARRIATYSVGRD